MRTRLLLVAATLVAFGASLGSGFHLDDYAIFSDGTLVSGSGWLHVWSPGRTRPLTDLTFWLNYQLGGQDPLGYHALNVLLHLGAVLLAYECARRLLPGNAAWIAAAIFAVHPLQSEAVDYVSARSIVLATVLCLGSLLAWMENRHWIAAALFLMALLANEQCAAFPLLVFVMDRKNAKTLGAMLVLATAAEARALYVNGFSSGFLLAQGSAILRYFGQFVMPYRLTIDPALAVPPLWLGLLTWASAGMWMVVASIRKWSWLLTGFLLLLPASSLIAAPELAADRRMYLPLFAFTAAASLLLARAKPAAAIAVVVVLTGWSVSRTEVWNSDEKLWREAVERAPDAVRPKVQLAHYLRATDALEVLASARRLAPQDPSIAAETGRILLAQGQATTALEEFSHAIAVEPSNALHFNNRGVAFEALGQTAAARDDFEHALRLNPNFTEARENLRKLTGAP